MTEMEQMVSSLQKKTFIKWLIEQQVLENRETVWLLNYLRSNERLLNMIHFVDTALNHSRVITISCSTQRECDFEYVKESVSTTDPEKAFHDLRLNQEEPVYVKINLDRVLQSPEYFAVLEDGQDTSSVASVHETYGEAVDLALEAAERLYAEAILYEKINQALDCRDRRRFLALTGQWNALKKDLQ